MERGSRIWKSFGSDLAFSAPQRGFLNVRVGRVVNAKDRRIRRASL